MEIALNGDARALLRSESPTPLYHQIFTLLRERVLRGELVHGAQLPTEFELADSFGVSRITAKRALDQLAAEGLVERRRGKGTHVIHRVEPKPVPSPLTGLLESLEVLAEITQVRVLQFGHATPPEPVRALFGLSPRAQLAHAVRLRLRAQTPFGYYTTWTDTDHPGFNADSLARSSRIKLFENIGLRLRHVEQVLSAVNADALTAMHLQVEPGTALLSMERRAYDADGRMVDLLNALYRPDQFTYRMTMDVQPATA